MFLSIWGKDFADTIATNAKTTRGQFILALPILAISLGVGAVSWRVASATENDFSATPGILPPTYPRFDKEAPELGLVDQNGETVTLAQFAGKNVLVTFAFGNCEAICPMVVHDVKNAQAAIREGGGDISIVVVTLDPWRDTPSRLPHLANQWELGEGAYALGGTVDEVNAVLDEWDVPRTRDPSDGNIIHPRLSFIVDANGQIAYAVSAGADAMVDLASRLQ
jgi:cytochrome oxidase Cu insertion factor (SCO1/SenC/PrrC family)